MPATGSKRKPGNDNPGGKKKRRRDHGQSTALPLVTAEQEIQRANQKQRFIQALESYKFLPKTQTIEAMQDIETQLTLLSKLHPTPTAHNPRTYTGEISKLQTNIEQLAEQQRLFQSWHTLLINAGIPTQNRLYKRIRESISRLANHIYNIQTHIKSTRVDQAEQKVREYEEAARMMGIRNRPLGMNEQQQQRQNQTNITLNCETPNLHAQLDPTKTDGEKIQALQHTGLFPSVENPQPVVRPTRVAYELRINPSMFPLSSNSSNTTTTQSPQSPYPVSPPSSGDSSTSFSGTIHSPQPENFSPRGGLGSTSPYKYTTVNNSRTPTPSSEMLADFHLLPALEL